MVGCNNSMCFSSGVVFILLSLGLLTAAQVQDCSLNGFIAGANAGGEFSLDCTVPTTITFDGDIGLPNRFNFDGQGLVTLSGSDISFNLVMGASFTRVITQGIAFQSSGSTVFSEVEMTTTVDTTWSTFYADVIFDRCLVLVPVNFATQRAIDHFANLTCYDTTFTMADGVSILGSLQYLFVSLGGYAFFQSCTILCFAAPLRTADRTPIQFVNCITYGQLLGGYQASAQNSLGIGGTNCTTFGNIADILLSPLQVNGAGPYRSYAPLPCSPAINLGALNRLEYDGNALDQNGDARSQQGAPDAGAVESSYLPCIHVVPATYTEAQGAAHIVIAFDAGSSIRNRISSIDVPVTLQLSGGNATEGSDFLWPSNPSYVIPAGSSQVVVSVPIVQDSLVEFTEDFTVLIASTEAVVTVSQAEIDIVNSDALVVSWSPSDMTNMPTFSGTGTVEIDLNLPAEFDIIFTLTAQSSVEAPVIVTEAYFPEGAVSAFVTFTISDWEQSPVQQVVTITVSNMQPTFTNTHLALPLSIVVSAPTPAPTGSPTDIPTVAPTDPPTAVPTEFPTRLPTDVPTIPPSSPPTPTKLPTSIPTPLPTLVATPLPTTKVPSKAPSNAPTRSSTLPPSKAPTQSPSSPPSQAPTFPPTATLVILNRKANMVVTASSLGSSATINLTSYDPIAGASKYQSWNFDNTTGYVSLQAYPNRVIGGGPVSQTIPSYVTSINWSFKLALLNKTASRQIDRWAYIPVPGQNYYGIRNVQLSGSWWNAPYPNTPANEPAQQVWSSPYSSGAFVEEYAIIPALCRDC